MTYLDNLNPKQKEAVTTNLKKVLVIAGAGSGKTRVLTTRIKYLLANGANVRDIIAFIFTNKAAIEMKSRIGSLTPNITTFHSYAYRQLLADNNYLRLGFRERSQIIADTEKSKIVSSILKDHKDKYSNIPFIKAISLIKNKTPIKIIKEEDEALLHLVYLKYQETLKQNNLIDFDDMIPLFIELATNNEYFNYGIQLPYVLVDECQDINQVQYDLIKIIGKEYENIFMVGDDDQLIYSFRSSDIKILNDFKENCDKVIVLTENYRSNKDILEHANTLVSHNTTRLTKTLKAHLEDKAIIEYKDYASTSDEAIEVVNKIKKLFKEGIAPKDIAILYRNNNESLMLERELKKANINYTIYGTSPLFEAETIGKITLAIRIVFRQNEDYNFMNLINIEQAEKVIFREAYIKQSKNILEFAISYDNNKIKELATNLLNLRQELNNISDTTTFYNKLLEAIKYKTGMTMPKSYTENKINSERNIEKTARSLERQIRNAKKKSMLANISDQRKKYQEESKKLQDTYWNYCKEHDYPVAEWRTRVSLNEREGIKNGGMSSEINDNNKGEVFINLDISQNYRKENRNIALEKKIENLVGVSNKVPKLMQEKLGLDKEAIIIFRRASQFRQGSVEHIIKSHTSEINDEYIQHIRMALESPKNVNYLFKTKNNQDRYEMIIETDKYSKKDGLLLFKVYVDKIDDNTFEIVSAHYKSNKKRK